MTPLYEQVLRLLQDSPDRPLPLAWKPSPSSPEARPELTDDQLAVLRRWAERSRTQAGAVGRRLVREGTAEQAVLVGLELLARAGTAYDLPLVRTVALYRPFTARAGAALAALGGTASDLHWLADRLRPRHRITLIRGLCPSSTPAARRWLLHQVSAFRRMPGAEVRRVAEAVGLVQLLDDPGSDESTCLDAGRALLAMSRWDHHRPQIDRYRDAVPAYRALLRRSERWPPTFDRYALLLELAQELATGHSWRLDWSPGEPAGIVDRILAALDVPRWRRCLADALTAHPPLTRARAQWAELTLARLTYRHPARPGSARLDLWTVRGDPGWSDLLDACVLVDGVPLPCDRYIDQGFDFLIAPAGLGPGWAHYGEPGTVCERADGRVHWREPGGRTVGFDAAEYDAEVARAQADDSWAWPALLVADALHRRLSAEPELLTRWGCTLEWVLAENDEPGLVRLRFRHDTSPDGPARHLVLPLPVDDRPPSEQAGAAASWLAANDPVGRASGAWD
ncbi:hypothetical protein [Kitasatospora sp. NPDC002040]|uniref:hypothetical protein n=1 Tax=Kitasatospora sp. NPDC002040 TaxID=3154661 RepID=UPI0033251A1B